MRSAVASVSRAARVELTRPFSSSALVSLIGSSQAQEGPSTLRKRPVTGRSRLASTSTKPSPQGSSEPSRSSTFPSSSPTLPTASSSPASSSTSSASPRAPDDVEPRIPTLDKGKRKEAGFEIPPLLRAPGSPTRPIASDTTYVSPDNSMARKQEEREFLVREAKRGYYHDYNKARKETGGKLWTAPKVLIREDKGMYFPNIAGFNLLGKKTNTTRLCEGKTSIVALTSTRLAEEHIQTFMEPVLQDQQGNDDFAFIEINHQQNHLKAVLLSMFQSSLKRTVPEARWPHYFLSRGEWSYLDVSRPLGYENQIIGYIFLLDPNCKIRWAGCGQATLQEVQALRTATELLVRRVRESKSGTTKRRS